MKSVGGFAYLTADEMRAIDQEAIQGFGVDVLSLMENAGAGAAELARRMLGGHASGRRVTCLVGKGNNGGDGLVAARHLHNWGADVSIALGGARDDFRDVPLKQLSIVEKMGLRVTEDIADLSLTDLIIDALLGYNAKGDPKEPIAGIIRRANASGLPILAVDIPSGLDPSEGTPNNPCTVARATLTLGLPKTGFLNPASRRYVGELYLGDVSIPRRMYEAHSFPTPVFQRDCIVRVPL